MFNLSVIYKIRFLNKDMIVYGSVCEHRVLHTGLTGVCERSLNAFHVRNRHYRLFLFAYETDSRSLVVVLCLVTVIISRNKPNI